MNFKAAVQQAPGHSEVPKLQVWATRGFFKGPEWAPKHVVFIHIYM